MLMLIELTVAVLKAVNELIVNDTYLDLLPPNLFEALVSRKVQNVLNISCKNQSSTNQAPRMRSLQ